MSSSLVMEILRRFAPQNDKGGEYLRITYLKNILVSVIPNACEESSLQINSFHVGFVVSIKAIFLLLLQPFISFSRSIASFTSLVSSK